MSVKVTYTKPVFVSSYVNENEIPVPVLPQPTEGTAVDPDNFGPGTDPDPTLFKNFANILHL
jgi:hypothetical protein